MAPSDHVFVHSAGSRCQQVTAASCAMPATGLTSLGAATSVSCSSTVPYPWVTLWFPSALLRAQTVAAPATVRPSRLLCCQQTHAPCVCATLPIAPCLSTGCLAAGVTAAAAALEEPRPGQPHAQVLQQVRVPLACVGCVGNLHAFEARRGMLGILCTCW